MGINNLLPQLSKVSHKVTFSESRRLEIRQPHLKRQKTNHYTTSNIRAAIDISSWIASACHGNGAELLDERHLSNYGRAELLNEHEQSKRGDEGVESTPQNNDTSSLQIDQIQLFVTRAANSVLRKISSLQACLTTEILVVFDGDTPPIKRRCCGQRKKTRDEAASSRDAILGSSNNNPTSLMEDDDAMQQSSLSKISAAKKAGAHTNKLYMAVVTSLLKSLREKNIPFIVSPFEADGQLAYLSNNGLVDIIISEDSDFIGHGVHSILYKYREVYVPYERQETAGVFTNRKATAVLIRRKDFKHTMNQSFDLSGFNDVMLAILCVAAGCDYCDSLKGIGIKTAREAVKSAFDRSGTDVPKLRLVFADLFKKCYGNLNRDEKIAYENNFLEALVMFRHPIAFDPIQVQLVYSNYECPDPDLMSYKSYADIIQNKSRMEQIVGKLYCKEMALNVVEGFINPKTWTLFGSESETPEKVCEALTKWNTKTFEFVGGNNIETRSQNQTNSAMMSSQSSSAVSSASKLSSQTSSRSSNLSVLSPNLLPL